MNMSYCRFSNTLDDLRDCYDAMGNDDEMADLSEEEAKAKEKIIKLCQRIVDDYGEGE